MTVPSTKGRREVAVQLNTRVSLDTRDLIDEIARERGMNIRAVVEQAIERTWRAEAARKR